MEASVGQKAQKQHEFALASVSELAPSSSSSSSDVAWSSPAIARFASDCGIPELRFHTESELVAVVNVDLQAAKVRFPFVFPRIVVSLFV